MNNYFKVGDIVELKDNGYLCVRLRDLLYKKVTVVGVRGNYLDVRVGPSLYTGWYWWRFRLANPCLGLLEQEEYERILKLN